MTEANTAPYQLATGTVPRPNGTMPRPVSCAGNVNYFNCRAVTVNICWSLHMIKFHNLTPNSNLAFNLY